MIRTVAGLLLLSVVPVHLLVGHSLIRTGPTPHEIRHAAWSRPVRVAATVAWLAYLAVAAALICL